jgi:adenosylhomocysteinase
VLWAGKNVVVCGYGWCGRGVASRARGLGAKVIVTEVQPVRALEAAMDGFQVMSLAEATPIGDIFITLTGDINVLDRQHFEAMKSGAILANSGHFNVELNIKGLEEMSETKRHIRDNVDEYKLMDGRSIYLLGEGRLINLAAAEGHPASVMDMSFANQALCLEYLATRPQRLPVDVYTVPEEIDKEVARLKLASMNITIDELTDEQQKYLSSWEEGT